MNVVIIDNYDSFTYNLSHLLKELGAEVSVYRNDKLKLEDIERFDKIVLSPGPGIPSEAGLLMQIIKEYNEKKPMLGVCLGHQAIGEFFGGCLTNLSEVFHGVQTQVTVMRKDYLFEGMTETIKVGRYHSWVVDSATLPDCLEATVESEEGQVMALRHKTLDIRGIQFHPESVLTPEGRQIMRILLKH